MTLAQLIGELRAHPNVQPFDVDALEKAMLNTERIFDKLPDCVPVHLDGDYLLRLCDELSDKEGKPFSGAMYTPWGTIRYSPYLAPSSPWRRMV